MKRFLEPGIWLMAGLLPPLLMLATRGLSDPFWAIEIAWILAAATGWVAAHPEKVRALHDALAEPRQIWKFEVHPKSLLLDALCLGAIVLAAYTVLPRAAAGLRPMDHDHTVHFYKAWSLWENFIKEGRLFGWSHQWFAGYPAQYLYPVGTDLLVVSLKVLSFGLISLDQAYAFAFFLFYVLKGAGAYALARVSVGRWAGLIAALIYLGDIGSFRFGGFVYTAEWGVWPQGLSIAFALLGLAMMRGVLFSDSWRPVAGAGLLMGGALLTHPMQIMHLILTFPVLMLALALSTELRGKKVRAGVRTLVSYVIAGGIGSLWVLTFISVSNTAESYGQPWRTLYDMGTRMHDSNLLEGSWSFWMGAAVVGTAGLVLSRKVLPAFLGFMTLLLLAASSNWVLSEFHFIEISEKFWFVQWQRFSMLVKPYMLIAAGAAFVGGFQLVRGQLQAHTGDVNRRVARAFIVAVIAAPILYGFGYQFRTSQLIQRLTEDIERPHRQARDRFVELANAQWKEKDVPFYRIALAVDRHDHSFADLGTRVEAPLYKPGFTPAAVFKYKMESQSTEMYEALNVRYILTTRTLNGSLYELVEDLGQGLKYYEFTKWKSEPFEVVEGTGEVELVSWADEEIVLRAAEGATGKIRLNVSNFPRWHVYRDGKELAVETLSIRADKERTGFMSFELAPGTYRIAFEQGGAEKLGYALFVFGLLLALGLLLLDFGRPRLIGSLAGRVESLLATLDRLETEREILLVRVASGTFIVIVVGTIGLAMWTPAVPMKSKDAAFEEVVYDFSERLNEAKVGRVVGTRSSTCPFILGKHVCAFEEHHHVYSTMVEIDDEWRRCTWAHPLDNQRVLRLAFDDVPAGKKIVGWYGIAQTGFVRKRQPVSFVVGVNGVAEISEETKKDDEIFEFVIDTSGKKEDIDVTFEVKAEEIGRRHFCFQAQVVE